jgi:hypothetical protein
MTWRWAAFGPPLRFAAVEAWFGMMWPDEAWPVGLGKEGFGWDRRGKAVKARLGAARYGLAGRGSTWSGKAVLVWSGGVSRDKARSGGQGQSRRGLSRRVMAVGARLVTAGRGIAWRLWLGTVRQDRAGRGEAVAARHG